MNRKREGVTAKAGYHHGDLREQLVQAAGDLVSRQGVSAFKVAEACRLAGVSTAAPYRHFRDREDILDAVSAKGFERLRDALLSLSSAFPTGTEASICACGRAYVAFAMQEPQIFRLMFGRRSEEDRMPSSGKDSVKHDVGAATYGVLLEHVARYLDCGVDEGTVLETSLMLWTGVHGLSSLLIDDNLDVSKMAVDVDHVVQSMTGRLLPHRQSP